MKLATGILASGLIAASAIIAHSAHAFSPVQSMIVPMNIETTAGSSAAIVLKNDSFSDQNGQAYLQTGFIEKEMAGDWVRVPSEIKKFKVDYFRVLMGSANTIDRDNELTNTQIYFQMGVRDQMATSIPNDIENVAAITPGPYWNDIPAIGDAGKLDCATGGEYVGAALEFAHSGAPSVFRDLDGIASTQGNVLFAIPGGWNYSVAYGLRGDWVLRVVGHEAAQGECK
jgi:hypothetical protein